MNRRTLLKMGTQAGAAAVFAPRLKFRALSRICVESQRVFRTLHRAWSTALTDEIAQPGRQVGLHRSKPVVRISS
jgi:hypothetical protein